MSMSIFVGVPVMVVPVLRVVRVIAIAMMVVSVVV